MRTDMRINGRPYTISDEDVRQVARNSCPEEIKGTRRYYVEVGGKRFPPKQLIRLVTGTTDSFGSTNARSALTRLGFTVKSI